MSATEAEQWKEAFNRSQDDVAFLRTERDKLAREIELVHAELDSHNVPRTWGPNPDYVPGTVARIAHAHMRRAQATRFDAGKGVEIVRHWTVGTNKHHWKILGATHAHGASAWDLEKATYKDAEEAFLALTMFTQQGLHQ